MRTTDKKTTNKATHINVNTDEYTFGNVRS